MRRCRAKDSGGRAAARPCRWRRGARRPRGSLRRESVQRSSDRRASPQAGQNLKLASTAQPHRLHVGTATSPVKSRHAQVSLVQREQGRTVCRGPESPSAERRISLGERILSRDPGRSTPCGWPSHRSSSGPLCSSLSPRRHSQGRPLLSEGGPTPIAAAAEQRQRPPALRVRRG